MSTFVFKSTDAGAPVISTAAGSFRDMLKKCLVTGYGALPGAGWTEKFVSGNTSVFEGAGGGAVLQVIDPGATTAGATNSTTAVCLRMFDSMTSATVGVNGTGLTGVPGVDKTGMANRAWVVVATPNTVHFMLNYYGYSSTGTGGIQHFSFGKFDSLLPGDTNNSIIWTGNQTANNDTNSVSLSATHIYIPHDYTGLSAAKQVNLSVGIQQSYIGDYIGSGNALAFPNQIDGKLHLLPVRIYEPGAGYRGVLPGILSSTCPNAPFANLDTVNGADGKTYVVMQGYNAGQWVFLERSSTW
jgi:hypothetical protein